MELHPGRTKAALVQKFLAVLRSLTLDRLTRFAWLCVLIALTRALLCVPDGIAIRHTGSLDHYLGFNPEVTVDVTGRLELLHDGSIAR